MKKPLLNRVIQFSQKPVALLTVASSITLALISAAAQAQTADDAFNSFCASGTVGQTSGLSILCAPGTLGTFAGGQMGNFSFASLSPSDNTSTSALTNVAGSSSNIAIENRLKQRRSGKGDATAFNLILNNPAQGNNAFAQPPYGGGASADNALQKDLGFFGSLKYTDGDRDDANGVSGFDFESLNLQLGMDYKASNQSIVGVTLNISDSETDASGSGSNSDSNEIGLSVFGSYYSDSGLYLDVILGYSVGDTDFNRDLAYTVDGFDGSNNISIANSTIAKASADNKTTHLSIGGGYNLYQYGLTLNPFAQLNWLKRSVDSYRESASASTALCDPANIGACNLDDIEQLVIDNFLLNTAQQNINSITSVIGIDASKAFNSSWGVFAPKVSLSWVHQFKKEEDLTARFASAVNSTSTSFNTETADLDSDYFVLGLGITDTYANNLVSFFQVETVLGHNDISQYSITAGLRKEF